MQKIIMALDELQELLEQSIPANPSARKNDVLAKALESDLRDYFKAIEQAFPFHRLQDLYYKYVPQEGYPI